MFGFFYFKNEGRRKLTREEFLDKLKDIVNRANSGEEGYIELCLVEDIETLLENFQEEE